MAVTEQEELLGITRQSPGAPHSSFHIYKDNLCKLEDGTIAGSVLKLNKGVLNVYNNSTIPLHECVNCATLNPATTIGVADRKGSIEVGKDAYIVILDNEFNVKKTIIGGVVRYEA